jgi:hypothetical protein
LTKKISPELQRRIDEVNEWITNSRAATFRAYQKAIEEGMTSEQATQIIPYLSNERVRQIIEEVYAENDK